MLITKSIKILFHNDYWDGPLSGICELKKEMYFFDVKDMGGWIGEDDDSVTLYDERIYNLRKIYPWQLVYELYWHTLFINNVEGVSLTEYDTSLINDRFKIDEDFYEKQKREYKKISYKDNEIINEFIIP